MSESPERRTAKRISIRLPVVYRGADGTAHRSTTENVSRRGMLIVAKAEPAGTRLRVAVTGSDGRERQVDAQVVRSTPDGRVAVTIGDAGAAHMDEIVDATEQPPAP